MALVQSKATMAILQLQQMKVGPVCGSLLNKSLKSLCFNCVVMCTPALVWLAPDILHMD